MSFMLARRQSANLICRDQGHGGVEWLFIKSFLSSLMFILSERAIRLRGFEKSALCLTGLTCHRVCWQVVHQLKYGKLSVNSKVKVFVMFDMLWL